MEPYTAGLSIKNQMLSQKLQCIKIPYRIFNKNVSINIIEYTLDKQLRKIKGNEEFQDQ